MHRSTPQWRSMVLSVCLVASAVPTAAQNLPRAEIFGGYQMLSTSGQNLPVGWGVDVAGNVNRWLAAAAEVGMARGRNQDFDLNLIVSGRMLAGGARFTLRKSPRVAPFAHVFYGMIHSSITVPEPPGRSDLERRLRIGAFPTVSRIDPTLQLGTGLNLAPSYRFGIRVWGDYLRVFGSRGKLNLFRLSTGVVVPFGRR